MPITKKEVDHIADLARIRLTEGEKEKMADDLGAVLDYIDRLNEVDTENVEPAANITGLENVLRDDTDPVTDAERAERMVKAAPHHHDGYIKVKQVFTNED